MAISRSIGKTKTGRPGIIVSDIVSYPGMNITQKQWDQIFGKKDRLECFKSKTIYGDNKKEFCSWYEDKNFIEVIKIGNEIKELKINGQIQTA